MTSQPKISAMRSARTTSGVVFALSIIEYLPWLISSLAAISCCVIPATQRLFASSVGFPLNALMELRG